MKHAEKPLYHPPRHITTVRVADALAPLSAVERRYAPELLYAAGDLTLLAETTRVAVVGSRNASAEGLRRATKLAALLAAEGIVVVSGLAAGVDQAAHEGALRAEGRTIAAVGTPLSLCYPPEHARLQEEIYTNHLLVSQFEEGHRTLPRDFVMRNRTMALLSHASVIVEAHDESGALSQAAETQRLGRPLFFLRSVLEDPKLEWPARFQKKGARVLADVADLLAVLRPSA
jgi:DNA processing protein